MHEHTPAAPCPMRSVPPVAQERAVLSVVALTTATMVLEIAAGYISGSMALLADGWHMATHVGALGLASAAYALSRRYVSHHAFTFGTRKFHGLAGYTSGLGLGLVALGMIAQALSRLVEPRSIDFSEAIPVAVLGLLVNLASIHLLHGHDDAHSHEGPHGHDHHHDHSHQAALLHVVADALTSALAIAALLAARFMGWLWLDPLAAVVGGLLIGKWSLGLCRATASELLDVTAPGALETEIRRELASIDDVRVDDLHVWPLGAGSKACVVTITSAFPRDVTAYREVLSKFGLAHLTIEVRRCTEGHLVGSNAAPGRTGPRERAPVTS